MDFPKYDEEPLSPASYAHFGPANVVYYVRRFHYGYKQVVMGERTDSNPVHKYGDVTLTLGDGQVKVLQENQEGEIKSSQGENIGLQKGNQIDYGNSEVLEELVYNTLTVPNGKKFDLVLSDGTRVKLNSGSSIRYPVKFINGAQRKVFLKGEAYFDVARDENHAFIVNTNNLNVEVLGTEFNVSYYPEDQHISTVLVEGSVKLYNQMPQDANGETTLTPGDLASWDKKSGKLSIKKVDTSIYTAWKDGVLLFKNESFENIRKKLERHFDIAIENNVPLLENQVYTASFTNETIGEIMEAFDEDTPFDYVYDPKLNKITITN
ncbi:FecR domain-containing protein [Flagellimonas marinaquae]|nr:FecR domain-containing protein [Allomuricauda aquimarina]